MILFLSNLASLFCVVVAGVMCYNGREGWGYFLFVAVLLHCTIKSSSNDDDDSDDDETPTPPKPRFNTQGKN